MDDDVYSTKMKLFILQKEKERKKNDLRSEYAR